MEITKSTITAKEYRQLKLKKKLKFNNKIVEYQGMKFRSKGELNRWKELKILEVLGEIRNLMRQVRYIVIDGKYMDDGKPIYYYADAVYDEKVSIDKWIEIVEDYKGVKTPLYKIKKALMHVKYGIVIRET